MLTITHCEIIQFLPISIYRNEGQAGEKPNHLIVGDLCNSGHNRNTSGNC